MSPTTTSQFRDSIGGLAHASTFGTPSATQPPPVAAGAAAPNAAATVSAPLAELPRSIARDTVRGKACTELVLSHRGIERLSGFEAFPNLECLWLNGNRLRAVVRLDANTRLKQLYIHDNELCTLRGSLARLRFLTHLDASNNALRDLSKVLSQLERLKCLKELSLQGNPCCEEPGYRLLVLQWLPWLEVLDWHRVTEAERREARELSTAIAACGAPPPAVAFLRRVPQEDAGPDAVWRRRAPERSVLEVELGEAAERVKDARREAAARAEAEVYARNPDAAFWAPRDSLPPPPGLVAAHAAATAARERATSANDATAAGSDANVHSSGASRVATGTAGSSDERSGLLTQTRGPQGHDIVVLTFHHGAAQSRRTVKTAASRGVQAASVDSKEGISPEKMVAATLRLATRAGLQGTSAAAWDPSAGGAQAAEAGETAAAAAAKTQRKPATAATAAGPVTIAGRC